MRANKAPSGVCVMGIRDQKNYDICQQCLSGVLTVYETSQLLGKSPRQTKRILRKIRELGMFGIKHGNVGKKPWNRIDEQLERQVRRLLSDRYFDFNVSHFREKLLEDHGLVFSHDTLLRWAHKDKLVKSARSRPRPRIHKTRHRMPRSGMLLQMDGSHHRWLGPQFSEFCLVGNIDDATGVCPYAEFFPGEDTFSVMTVMKKTIEQYGIPEVLYVDRAGFHGKIHPRAKNVDWSQHLTHLQKAMSNLGVRVLFAPSPQAKGRVERMWKTFQDRLIPELRIRNIQRIPTANEFLQKHFIPDFNRRFSVPAREPINSAWKPLPDNFKEQLKEIFCLREYRRVSPGDTISWDGKTYAVEHDYNFSLRGLQIELRTYLDQSWAAFYANKPVKLARMDFLQKKAA